MPYIHNPARITRKHDLLSESATLLSVSCRSALRVGVFFKRIDPAISACRNIRNRECLPEVIN